MNGENKTTIVNKTIKTGITFGSALAMVISYTTWHSVGWAIFHGLLSWVYVVYFVLRYSRGAAGRAGNREKKRRIV